MDILAAVQRWFLTQPERAAMSRSCQDMVKLNAGTDNSKELSQSRYVINYTSIELYISLARATSLLKYLELWNRVYVGQHGVLATLDVNDANINLYRNCFVST